MLSIHLIVFVGIIALNKGTRLFLDIGCRLIVFNACLPQNIGNYRCGDERRAGHHRITQKQRMDDFTGVEGISIVIPYTRNCIFPCRQRWFSNECRVTWGKAPRFGDDLSLTYLFASTSDKSYKRYVKYILTEYHMRSDNMSAKNRLLIAALKMSQMLPCGAKRPAGL